MKRIDLAIVLGMLGAILLTSFNGFAQDCEEVRDSALRLHILANSDSEEDQAVKLAVRDAVLAGTEELFTASHTKEEAQALALQNLECIESLARAEVRRQGYDWDVTARVVNRYFETREYEDFTMPAGRYDTVQLEIGAGEGRNWWCVMYPPMCVPAASDTVLDDETALVELQIRGLGEQPVYKPAFAAVEAVEALREKFSR